MVGPDFRIKSGKSLRARREKIMALYGAMIAHFGPSRWWPAETPFEVAVGAVLTQNTAWGNVEKALENLRARNALRPEVLRAMSLSELEECLRPSGFFRLKARRLGHLLNWLALHPGWDEAPHNLRLDFLRRKDTEALRAELLAISGIGPETADSILLYALDKPSFVVDAYTRRMFSRHRLVDEDIAYAELRAFFMDVLDADVPLYNEYHALIVRTGKDFCRKSRPLCRECPLGEFFGRITRT